MTKPDKVAIVSHCILNQATSIEYWQTSEADEAMKTIMEDSFISCGIQNFEQVLLSGVQSVDDETRKGYLELAYRLGKEF